MTVYKHLRQRDTYDYHLRVFAQFETALRKERQLEGIAKAKAAGVYRGRKPSVPVDDFRRLHAAGTRPSDIAKQLGIGRASVYRSLDNKLRADAVS